MTIRIAILVACAGTLALAQSDMARANTTGAFESKNTARVTEIGPESIIVVAQNQGGSQVQEVVVTGSRVPKLPKAGKKAGTGMGGKQPTKSEHQNDLSVTHK
jgi:hypothetical protein